MNNVGLKYEDLVDMMIERKPVELVLGHKKEAVDMVPEAGWSPATSGCRKGMAIITKISSSAPNGDKATFNVDFTGTGPLEKVTAGS